MKTQAEIDNARAVVTKWMGAANLKRDQLSLLVGMSVSLQWVSGIGGGTLQALIDGMPIEGAQLNDSARAEGGATKSNAGQEKP